jgi:hypothetical protein
MLYTPCEIYRPVPTQLLQKIQSLDMVKLIWPILLFCSHFALAQNLSQDLEFIETLNTQANAFNVPLYVDLAGNLSIISAKSNSISLNPVGYATYKKDTSNYIKPVRQDELRFEEQRSGLDWLEIKRMRWEIGLGLGAQLASNVISVGLAPYKGARQVMIRQKKSQDEITPKPRLPDELEDVGTWTIGDRGSFQRYGGVQIDAGASFLFANLLTVGVTIQNLFSVVVEKISDTKIKLSFAEEKLNQRRIQSGFAVADVKLNFFNGKRLTTHFVLDLEEPFHHQLYRLALKGKLNQLQAKLPLESQALEWKGSEKIGYIGIPALIGKYTKRSEYEMEFDDEEEVLDMKSQRSSGWFVPLRNHNRVVYQTDTRVTLFWFSEMNNADGDVLARKFLIPGKLMGAKGFENMIPHSMKIGSALSQLGMSFSREELEAVSPEMLEEILVNFKSRCESMNLKCAKKRIFFKIAKKLRLYREMKWDDVRDKLGFLMMDEPALIHSYIKTIKSKKRVYFKFLNEKYQSLEGTAPIEI